MTIATLPTSTSLVNGMVALLSSSSLRYLNADATGCSFLLYFFSTHFSLGLAAPGRNAAAAPVSEIEDRACRNHVFFAFCDATPLPIFLEMFRARIHPNPGGGRQDLESLQGRRPPSWTCTTAHDGSSCSCSNEVVFFPFRAARPGRSKARPCEGDRVRIA